MSSKCSLKFERDEVTGQQVHLYREAGDRAHIYLEVGGFHFESASSEELSGNGGMRVAIRFPKEWARKLGLLEGCLLFPDPEMDESE
jgi:hypothetical protein